MAKRDAPQEQSPDETVSDAPDYGAGRPVEASRTPEEVENGTLGQEGSTGASEEESEKAGSFGLGFVRSYEDPILLSPPATASDTEHETRGYGSK